MGIMVYINYQIKKGGMSKNMKNTQKRKEKGLVG